MANTAACAPHAAVGSPADPRHLAGFRRTPPPPPRKGLAMKKVIALGLIAVTAIGLSGCTDSDAPTPSRQTSGDLRKVRVAALPIAETAALWGGIEAGIFAEHGLEVEVLPAQGGAQAIPALMNGDIDFAIGQPFGPFRADLQNLGVVDHRQLRLVLRRRRRHQRRRGLGGIRHHASRGPGGQAGLGQQPRAPPATSRSWRPWQKDGGDPTHDRVRRGGVPRRAGPARRPATSTPRWVPEPFVSQLKGAGRHVRRGALPGDHPRPDHADHHHHHEAHGREARRWSTTSPRR